MRGSTQSLDRDSLRENCTAIPQWFRARLPRGSETLVTPLPAEPRPKPLNFIKRAEVFNKLFVSDQALSTTIKRLQYVLELLKLCCVVYFYTHRANKVANSNKSAQQMLFRRLLVLSILQIYILVSLSLPTYSLLYPNRLNSYLFCIPLRVWN